MKRINSIQGIRALCFFQVFFAHSCYFVGKLYMIWLDKVPWAMELFFMISGFGIVLGYQNRINSTPNKLSEWCKFVWKKVKKIYPLHITMLLVSILYLAIQIVFNGYVLEIKTAVISFVAQLTLCLGWIPVISYYTLFNPAVWFLTSLLFCYFLAIPSLHYLKKMKDYRVITILLIVFKTAVSLLPLDMYWFFRWPVLRFTDFFLGMLAAEFYLHSKEVKKPERAQVIATLGLIVSVLLSCPYYTGMKYIYPNAFLGISCFFFLRYIPYDGMIERFLGNRILVWFGNLGLELFLIHPVVIHFLWGFWGMIGRQLDIILVILEFIVSIIAAVIWNRFVAKRIYRN